MLSEEDIARMRARLARLWRTPHAALSYEDGMALMGNAGMLLDERDRLKARVAELEDECESAAATVEILAGHLENLRGGINAFIAYEHDYPVKFAEGPEPSLCPHDGRWECAECDRDHFQRLLDTLP